MKLDPQAIDQYIKIVNQVAVVSKVDLEDKITFVNELFCNTSGYSENELIGSPISTVIHKDISSKLLADMKNTTLSGSTWNGTIKKITKEGLPFYVTITSFPIYDTNSAISEIMSVGFITTDVEQEKQQFHKKVRSYVQDNNRKFLKARSMIDDLKNEIKTLEHKLMAINRDQNELELCKKRASRDRSQINELEKQIRTLTHDVDKRIKVAKEKYDLFANENTKLAHENKKLTKENIELNDKLKASNAQIMELQNHMGNIAHKNKEMSDVFEHEQK
jgi:PAS domain S-box-containing protein